MFHRCNCVVRDHVPKTETQKVSNVINEPEVQRTYVQVFSVIVSILGNLIFKKGLKVTIFNHTV